MNEKNEIKTLDQLRAGLSADSGDSIDAMNPNLVKEHSDLWQGVIDSLDARCDEDRITSNRLRIIRRQVLNGEVNTKNPWMAQWVTGAVASVALVLSVSIWWGFLWDEDQGVIANSSNSNLENKELATNVDFYSWLETQKESVADAGGS